MITDLLNCGNSLDINCKWRFFNRISFIQMAVSKSQDGREWLLGVTLILVLMLSSLASAGSCPDNVTNFSNATLEHSDLDQSYMLSFVNADDASSVLNTTSFLITLESCSLAVACSNGETIDNRTLKFLGCNTSLPLTLSDVLVGRCGNENDIINIVVSTRLSEGNEIERPVVNIALKSIHHKGPVLTNNTHQ